MRDVLVKAQADSARNVLKEVQAECSVLRFRNTAMAEALRALYDEQNGAPLEARREHWKRAMDLSGRALLQVEGRGWDWVKWREVMIGVIIGATLGLYVGTYIGIAIIAA